MLPLKLIQEVRRLVEAGELSQRQIAIQVGVSRGVVSAIASGKRGLYGRESDSLNEETNYNRLPPHRCPGCGARVSMPCVLCRAREYTARQQLYKQLRRRSHAA
ncbi:MAG: hypothetical protein SH868_01555 [Bythopirellula sp.]|nr:hypothetical protein [Bythopirellula sp.]